jgi:hypothetical protein
MPHHNHHHTPQHETEIDKAIAESIRVNTFFYTWANMNTTMKWILVILLIGAIIVGIIFLVKAWKKADETSKNIKEEDVKEL